METIERPRGILSKADRRYLENTEEYSHQAAFARRQAIIERVHHALHDFPRLMAQLDEDARREAFEDPDPFPVKTEHVLNNLPSAFAFLYLGITDIVEPEELAKDAVEDIAASGVRKAFLQRGISVDEVEIDIDVTRGEPLDELEKRGYDELSYDEMNKLLESGRLSDLSIEEILDLFEAAARRDREDDEE